MDKQIEEMLIQHLPNRYEDTLSCYTIWDNDSWKDMNADGTMNGFLSYFFLDFRFDMIITAATDNRFSKAHWKVLRDTVAKRTKPLRIQSDPSNPILHRVAKKYGGKFYQDEIYFPTPGLTIEEEMGDANS